jgi:hypothetical protein
LPACRTAAASPDRAGSAAEGEGAATRAPPATRAAGGAAAVIPGWRIGAARPGDSDDAEQQVRVFHVRHGVCVSSASFQGICEYSMLVVVGSAP